MEQIKIFTTTKVPTKLEQEVNDFLRDNENEIAIKDIQINTAASATESFQHRLWTAMVRYNTL